MIPLLLLVLIDAFKHKPFNLFTSWHAPSTLQELSNECKEEDGGISNEKCGHSDFMFYSASLNLQL